jgi:outer membrane protein assembly factor BamA
MLHGKPFIVHPGCKAIAAALLLLSFYSCKVSDIKYKLPTVVKNYPAKPFIFKTNIKLEGEFSKEQKNELETRLKNQLDDSSKVGTVPRIFWQVMKKPPAYDYASIDRSTRYMHAYLLSVGYFKDSILVDTIVKVVPVSGQPDQKRVGLNFRVKPGKQTKIDSIRYNIADAEMQRLSDSAQKGTFLKKGDPFAIAPVSNELDRLVDLYRNNGYLRFTKEELKVFWDTLNVAVLNPALDPFEQLEMLQQLKESRENPKVNLEVRLTPGFDSSKLKKYYVGNVSVYPDYNQDTAGYKRKEVKLEDVKIIYYRNLFRPKILLPYVYLKHGELYRQRNYLKTISRFNSLGTWGLTNIERQLRNGQDTVDFRILLSPAKKYSINTSLEGSRNQSVISGNLFGLAINLGFLNRNFAKSAIQTNTNARFGIEFGSNAGEQFIQTQQVSFSHTIYFPRTIPHFGFIPSQLKENSRTLFSFNASNIDRKDLYNLTTFNGAWGYQFQWDKKFLAIRFPNIEYSYLKPRQQLIDLWTTNPSLRNIFTDGFIASLAGNFNVNGGKNKNINNLNVNSEVTLPLNFIHSKFLDTNLYQFIKLDVEFVRKIQYSKTAIALRLFAGVGVELNSTVNPLKKNSLPFFKQYFSGGPNSMRAWGLRKLGPGSVIKDFYGTNAIPDRFGDVQLEANFEYRFPLFTVAGIKLNGALFTDVGNVWLLKKSAGVPEEVFSLSKLGEAIAVGSGIGFRVDLSLFVIRLDVAYKVKDPSPSVGNAALQNKWFGYNLSNGKQFQLGISYPFIL